jgi:exodeoxyribonuclease V alpha subunit
MDGASSTEPMSAAHEVLAGRVERVTYHQPENGFTVLQVKPRGRMNLVTVVGHAATITAGEWLTASGSWVNDHKYGPQFRASFLKLTSPDTPEGIERYLASGLIRGIGRAYAKRLVKGFGVQVLEIIETAPERLREIPGIGAKRAQNIAAAWAEQKVIRDIMLFLHSHGVSSARAVRIFKTYGADAIKVMSDNPYRLARDIRGIGFKTADAIAANLGIEKTALVRLRAGISFALNTALDQGHCALPRAELLSLAATLLDVPATSLAEALNLELAEGVVIVDTIGETECIFLDRIWRAERQIALRLTQIASTRYPWPSIEPESALAWVQQQLGMTLAPSQAKAVQRALRSKLMVITGGPGVGKTTIMRAILTILAEQGVRILLAAPTGRAAKRLSEASGFEAKTIHRLLEVDPRTGGFRRHAEAPLFCDLLVLDEASMIDVPLMQAVTRALPDHAALLMVGDIDQLPSVGPGLVLADLIGSRAVPVVRLTEIFRQTASSRIITNAHQVNRGQMPELAPSARDSDFHFITAATPEAAMTLILTLVSERIPAAFGLDPTRDIQVLCPMTRGSLGSRALNVALQAALNGSATPRIERFGWRFAPGDKVMQIVNDYEREVYNGDIGFVSTVDLETGELMVNFEGREVVYSFGELDLLVPAYAMTIHKSQGSEYPAVVIPLTTQHYPMLQRNLLYTGMTRGKRLVVLVGDAKAIGIAVQNRGSRRRWTKLQEWLEKNQEKDAA